MLTLFHVFLCHIHSGDQTVIIQLHSSLEVLNSLDIAIVDGAVHLRRSLFAFLGFCLRE